MPSAYRECGEHFTLYSPCGIGFCFEFTGSVTLRYTHGSDTFQEELVNTSPRYKSFSISFSEKAPLTLDISGEAAHCAVNACIYDTLTAKGDVPIFSEYFSYDMAEEDGFMGVLSVTGGEYSLHGSEIRIPIRSDSEYSVEYSYRPEPLSYDNLGERLGIDPCLYEAAALLTAYYVWLDDDAQKAMNYRTEYDVAVKEILKRRQVEIAKVSTNGW